jgi:iron complex outermembrane receptor protein
MTIKSAIRLAAIVLASTAVGVYSAAASAADSEETIETVTVTASRLPADLQSFPGTVTVVSRQDVETQTGFSNDLGQLLENTVPGMAVSSSGSYSNFDQTLRGRKPAVFIDGVPVSVSLRDGGRDDRLIGPGAIETVQVVSGATAIYGLGGAGGLINYMTRNPGNGPPEFRTTVSAGGSLTHLDDSLNWSIDQDAAGRVGDFSYVATGYYEQYSSLFGADGGRIPPDPQSQGGIADTKTYDVFAKFGYDLTATQHLYLSGSAYKTLQDTNYSSGAGVFRVSESPALGVAPPGGNQFTRNDMGTLRYLNDDIFGSSLDIDAFYNTYSSLFAFYPYPYYPPNGGQTAIDNDVQGIRTTINTPVQIGARKGSVLWGVDYSYTDARQQLTDGQLLVPDLKEDAVAPFVQANLPVLPWLVLNGGLRWERDSVSVDTFTTIPIYSPSLPGGVTVQGGTLDYSKPLFNAGVVISPFKSEVLAGLSAYAAYSQGFSLGDMGRALRSTTASSVTQFDFKPLIVDSYEIGLRTVSPGFKAHVAAYYNTAEYGSTFNAVTFALVRAPEEIWGFEAGFDASPSDKFEWGGSLSWLTGIATNTTTGIVSPLDDSRIPPPKLLLYAQQQFLPNLSGRAQLTYSGAESRFPNNPPVFGESDIPAFALLDLMVNYKTGAGTWTFALNDALNERYFPPDAYIYATNTNFTEGEGATLKITYSLKY